MNLFNELNTVELRDFLILLDIDGTIINDNDHEVCEKNLKIINELKKYNQVYLCSNSRNRKRNIKVAELVNAEYIDTDLRKPSKKILDLIDHTPFSKRLVIGDKFLTDGLFAKNIKAEFIKVKRITSKKDRAYINFLYWIDDLICKIINR